MNSWRWVLALLLLLATFQSSYYFLAVKRVGVSAWLNFNACAVANLTYLVGFVLWAVSGARWLMCLAVLPLLFFGTGGLFVFSWSGMNIIPQAGHILMTANVGLLVLDIFRSRDFRAATVGLLLSIGIFSMFIGFQQNFVRTHVQEFRDLMFPVGSSPGRGAGTD